MFNLERAIAEWIKTLRKNRAVEDGDAAELEGYLRDKVEDLTGRGMSEEDAFREAEAEFLRAERLDEAYAGALFSKPGKRPSWQAPRLVSDLLWNYWKTAGRKIRLQKGYAAVSIGSLVLAMTVGLLTLVWAHYEMSYDRFHRNANSIYRVLYQDSKLGNGTALSVPLALPAAAKRNFPEIRASSSFDKVRADYRFESPKLIDYKSSFAFVEPDFLAMFDFPLLKGDPRTALSLPRSVVLTETAARKFFGSEDPIGRSLLFNDAKIPLTVRGVLRDIPETSHIDFDMLMPDSDFKIFEPMAAKSKDDWSIISPSLYIQLAPGTDVSALANKMTRLAEKHQPGLRPKLTLQPLRDIHLRSSHLESRGLSDRRRIAVHMGQIRIFLLVALAVLFIGGINYVNLATARSLKRAKEVGVRKANGASKGDILKQFLGESVLFAFAALAAAVGLTAAFGLPLLRRLTGMDIALDHLPIVLLLLEFCGLALVVGLLAGFYPAVFVSAFPPVQALKETFSAGGKSLIRFRRMLVGVQILCSAVLLSVIAVLILQLRYVDRKDLGFERDGLVLVNNNVERNRLAAFKDELQAYPVVRNVATGFAPLMRSSGHFPQGKTLWWEGKSPDNQALMDWHFVDEDYQKTYGLEMVAGRFFSRDFPSDKKDFVLNESAVKAMGVANPVGLRFKALNFSGRIIGVVRDFHAGTLKAEIRPMFFVYGSGFFSIAVRIDPRAIPAALKHIAAVVKKYDPERPFEYTFLDDSLRRMYDGDRLNARIVSIFGLVSILISCLGLFGLISFMAERRTKEIGIRKILGASVFRIVRMMSAEFAVLVGLSVLAAVPIGFLLASRGIGDFAYRIGLSWWIFAGSVLLVFLLALGAVGLRAARAASADPVESLRYE